MIVCWQTLARYCEFNSDISNKYLGYRMIILIKLAFIHISDDYARDTAVWYDKSLHLVGLDGRK